MSKIINHHFVQTQRNPPSNQRYATSTTRLQIFDTRVDFPLPVQVLVHSIKLLSLRGTPINCWFQPSSHWSSVLCTTIYPMMCFGSFEEHFTCGRSELCFLTMSGCTSNSKEFKIYSGGKNICEGMGKRPLDASGVGAWQQVKIGNTQLFRHYVWNIL